jgi:hypothetical protein
MDKLVAVTPDPGARHRLLAGISRLGGGAGRPVHAPAIGIIPRAHGPAAPHCAFPVRAGQSRRSSTARSIASEREDAPSFW